MFCFGAFCAKLRFNWLWMNHLHVDVCVLNKSKCVSFCFFFSPTMKYAWYWILFLVHICLFARNLISQCFLIYFTCDAIKFGFVWNIVIWTKCLEIYTIMSISYGYWNFGLFWNLSNLCIKLITTQIILGGLHGWGLVEIWTYSLLWILWLC
jgi:hypothetical protein